MKSNTNQSADQCSPEEELTWPIAVLKENQHYYMENGFMVFTEFYHRSRGQCCGNACRHCPFEHVNVRNK